jgi:hypothetical protein
VIARQIYEWMRKGGNRLIKFGTGQSDGSVYPIIEIGGARINPIYLSSNGKVYIQFGALINKPVFGPLEVRRDLMQRVNNISDVHLTDADLTKYPGIPLATIAADPNGVDKFMSVLRWVDNQIDQFHRAT